MSRLVPLQALRAVAALMVAGQHALHDAGLLAERLGLAFVPASRTGQAGVDIFFVISGFVMVHASRGLFGEPGAARIFLARRIARVVPLYWLVTTLYLAVAIVAPALLNGAVLDPLFVAASYAFWPMAGPDGFAQPLYSLGWTLNYEMAFYALFALAIPFARDRAVAGLIAALLALVMLGRLLPLRLPLSFWTDPIVLEFAAGMALGLARAHGLRLGSGVRAALAGLAVGALVLDVAFVPEVPRIVAYGIPAALLVAAAGLGAAGGRPGRLALLGEHLGDASYALYLVHPFAIRPLGLAAGAAGVVGPWSFLVLALAAALVASLVVHRWVERPLTGAARRALRV
ncbi:MAG TPA: acyltransferase [Salinarimonas sp.]|nr:acyltransferase [Salinarimonas sp.]